MNPMNPSLLHPMGLQQTSADHQLAPDAPRFTFVRPRQRAREVRSDDGRVTIKYWLSRWRDRKRRRIYSKWFFITAGRREAHNTENVTKARAREVANSIANGEITMLAFTQADKASYQRARELLRPTGKSLELVCSEYAEAHNLFTESTLDAPRSTLLEAVRYYLSHAITTTASRTCPEILAELLAARKADGAAQNTLDDLDSRLGRFARDFTGPVLSIAGGSMATWLRALPVSRRTRNNYRGALVAFYRYARQVGYVPKTWSVLDDIPRVKDEPVRISIFASDEIVRIIAAREDLEQRMADRRRPYKTLIPYLAIGAWAGCRHEEMCAGRDPRGKPLPVLDWRQVNLRRRQIHVLEEVARKIGRDRIVPISDNLVAWLAPYARPSGPICELANANNAFQRAAQQAKVKWKDNGLRRSFISYRLAIVKDIGQVALEAGTSPERINKNYKKTEDEEAGQSWFSIQPLRADVLPLFAWAKRKAN
jgi:integrase